MRRSSIQLLLALFVSVLASRAGLAADPAAGITKEYELGDLMLVVPDFTEAPALNEPRDEAKTELLPTPTTQPATQSASDAVELADAVAGWIKSLARANESAISIERIGEAEKKISVRATSVQHERIAQQIADVIAQRHTQITVESRFIHLTSAAEAKLPASAAEKIEFVRIPGRSSAGTLVEDGVATAIVDASGKDPDSSLLTAPRITLFDGQRAYVLVATQRSLTTGYNKSDRGEWEPKIEAFQTGLLLDARCRADASGKSIAINLKPELTKLLSVREEPFKDAPAGERMIVQVPTMDVRKLDALATIPSGGTMLYHVPAGPNVAPGAPRLYVLVRATVQRH